MNEQGAHFFDRYTDSSGCVRQGVSIETWREVTAGDASFLDPFHGVFFSMRSAPGARLFRGRELVEGRLAWAGLAYVLPPTQGFPLRYLDGSTGMTSVLLIYPYFKPAHDRSLFRFPPLGIGYVAAALRPPGTRSRCSTAPSFPGRTLSGGRALHGPRWWACTA